VARKDQCLRAGGAFRKFMELISLATLLVNTAYACLQFTHNIVLAQNSIERTQHAHFQTYKADTRALSQQAHKPPQQLSQRRPQFNIEKMSRLMITYLNTVLNPVNVRHGAHYTQLSLGVPAPSTGPQAAGVDASEDNQQNLEENTSPASKDTASDLQAPLNPVDLQHGAQYSEGIGQLPVSQADSEFELDEHAQDKQRSDSDEREMVQGLASPHSISEWYSDFQISEFITYTRDCLTATPPRSLATFYNVTTIASPIPSSSCLMLREAYRAGLAQLARSTDLSEVYTIGAPPPVTPFAGGFGPHWWVGRTPAQVRAGPLAKKEEIRNAEKTLERKTNAKQYRNRRLDEQRRKTVEGVRRQDQGLSMIDDWD
jgi:hypothetical protein